MGRSGLGGVAGEVVGSKDWAPLTRFIAEDGQQPSRGATNSPVEHGASVLATGLSAVVVILM